MVDPIAVGSAYGVSLLAASSYDFLKGIHTDQKIEKRIESAADEVAESHDLIINGYNPLLLALESGHTEDLIEDFKEGKNEISVDDLVGTLERLLIDEFDIDPETMDYDTNSVIEEYLKTFEMEIIVHDEIRSKIFLQYFRILSENQVSAAKEFVMELEQKSRRFNEQLNRFDSDIDRFEDQITEFDSNLGDFDNEINRLIETIDYIEAIEGQDDLNKDELRKLGQRLQGLESISEEKLQEATQAIGEGQEVNTILTNILVSVLKLDIADANKEIKGLAEYARQLELLEDIHIYADIREDILDIEIKNYATKSIYLHFLFESAIGKLLPETDQLENISIFPGENSSPYSKDISVNLETGNKHIPVHDWITIRVFCSNRKLNEFDELSSDLTSIYAIQVTKGDQFG